MAVALRAPLLKLFPASVGGILLLKGLLGPFPNVRLPETPNSAGREVVGRVGRDVKPPAHISP